MTFAPNILDIMFARKVPVLVTNYLIKVDEPKFVAISLDGKRVPTTKESTGIVPIAYTGFGLSVFDLDVFKKVPQPWFQPEFEPEKSIYTTEDNPCYRRMRDAGFTVYCDLDASKLVSHHGNDEWRWDKPRSKIGLSPYVERAKQSQLAH
jgi:hypothetical protein